MSRVDALSRPVDLASLAVFRVVFGVLAAVQCYLVVSDGHSESLWALPTTTLPPLGASLLPALDRDGAALAFYALGLLALGVAVGAAARAAAALFSLGLGALLAHCATTWVAPLLLLLVFAIPLAAAPAGRIASLHAWLRPAAATVDAPQIWRFVLCAQLAIVQFAMGLAALDADWLRGDTLELWIASRTKIPVLQALVASKGFLTFWSALVAAAFVIGAPALCFRRTRTIALLALGLVHVWMGETFALGVLPWLLLLGNLLFLPPDWPRRVFNWPRDVAPHAAGPFSRLWLGALALWLVLLAILPLRGLLASGPRGWHEIGRPLAWAVPGASKAGALSLTLTDRNSGESRAFDPADELTAWQLRRVAASPWLLQRYARQLASRAATESGVALEVRAGTLISLNGRSPQRLVDRSVDLVTAPTPSLLGATSWILPLDTTKQERWTATSEWPAPRDALPKRKP